MRGTVCEMDKVHFLNIAEIESHCFQGWQSTKQLKKIKSGNRPVLLSGGTLRTRSFHVLYITMAVQTKKQSLLMLNVETAPALPVVKVSTPE